MTNCDSHRPIDYILPIVLVVALHLLAIWALIHAMGWNEPAPPERRPLITQIVQASASSASLSASTTPLTPEMVMPPPPEITPPPIRTEEKPIPPKVTEVHRERPKAQASKGNTTQSPSMNANQGQGTAGEGRSTMGPPDRSAGAVPLNGVRLRYPSEMEAAGKEARVAVVCDVEASGTTSNCHVASSGVNAAFIEEALRYVRNARYRPATRNGVPVKQLGHRYLIDFRLD